MIIYELEDFKGGWFVGDFEPSIWRTKDFEVGYKHHMAGEAWPIHYHEHADELTLLLEGTMTLQGKTLQGPLIFTLDRGEIADPVFVTDCKVFVVKAPSIPGDKIEVAGGEQYHGA